MYSKLQKWVGLTNGADSTDDQGGDAYPQRPVTPVEQRKQAILALLEETAGPVRQQTITGRFDVSESTVARTLIELEAEGDIVRVRVGRQKIVALPDDDRLATLRPRMSPA